MKTFAFIRKIVHNYQNPHQNYHYCGYIGIIDDSKIPLSIQASNDLCDKEALDFKIEIHGGITFDCKLNSMTPIIPLTEIPQNWHQYRCIGFDLAHDDDIQNNVNTDYNFCVSETFHLKEQIENLIKI